MPYTMYLTQQIKMFSVMYKNPVSNRMQNIYATLSNFHINHNDLFYVIHYVSDRCPEDILVDNFDDCILWH